MWLPTTWAAAERKPVSAPETKQVLEVVDGYYAAYPPTSPGKDAEEEALIRQGEYLAKAGDCIACHTNVHGRTPAYAGRLPIATPFGTFYSPNITPDNETGIGAWTQSDFVRALREGHGPHGENYFPVYPFVYWYFESQL